MDKSFLVLGIDTSGEYCSVGLVRGEKILGEVNLYAPQEHSSQLIPSIDKILKDNNLKIQDVNGIAVSIGPGRFTGLRVGVATAKALAQALEIPIVGIPTLDMIAMNTVDNVTKSPLTPLYKGGSGGGFDICVMVDARKQQVYTALYSVKCQVSSVKCKKMTKDLALSIDELLSTIDQRRTTVFIGNAIPIYGEVVKNKLGDKTVFAPQELWYPRASTVALEGLRKLKRNKKGDNLFKLVPIYVREPDIRKS